ncbi:flavodoxin family protein [uncultured Desulfovibrio sp.]|uniref:flavodoxin family protein n=1 Tax=uncultured Desulfovibrio sp. TaxID=167968 RepID=UPI0026250ECB|nr:flavodoxin family protein [uncultured Desulfovibrio sp.]
MRILSLLGSPRANGTTRTMARLILEGLSGSGAAVEEIALQEKRIRPCRGCQSCARPPHACPLSPDDDTEAVFAAIAAADLVLWTSPVYFYGLPAQAKALVDRGQRLWSVRESGGGAVRGPVVLAALAAARPRGEQLFSGSLLGLKYFFACFGSSLADTRTLRGLAAPGDLLARPELCDGLRHWGRDWAGRWHTTPHARP